MLTAQEEGLGNIEERNRAGSCPLAGKVLVRRESLQILSILQIKCAYIRCDVLNEPFLTSSSQEIVYTIKKVRATFQPAAEERFGNEGS